MTNWQAKNFRLATAGEAELGDRGAWRDLLPHRPDAFIENYHVYRDFVAVSERSGGLGKVRIVPRKGDAFLVDADEPAYTMGLMGSPDENSSTLRYTYTSLTTPSTVFELDVATRARKVLKVEPVRGGYDASKYVTDYLHVKADDGASIPISVVRRKDVPKDGKAPLLVYGYGSYGYAMDPGFVVERLPLLDRGWVYAIAHIRGGQEMGRAWYDGGKLMNKKNTFTDFIRVTEHLVAEGYGRRDAVFAMGGSAGGLLVGAVVNMRPDLYRGVVAKVPFVDVVTTMLDDSIPLTSNEFDEWGDPRQRAAYEYMLSYSPYDNVRAQAYPSMFVETGLHDSQVQYFEPAKWVAKLRATKTDGNPLLFHVNMEAGHGGKSGRYEKFDQIARTWVFLLTTLERPDRRAHWP
jgi:oligopeptidase B